MTEYPNGSSDETKRFDASEVYCPSCDGDYKLAWSKEKDDMYVVCECNEAESIGNFVERFQDEYVDGNAENPRGYQ